MPDDKQGENSGEGKTFTQAEMDAALTEAKASGNKEGQTAAHAHWQSVGDKAISGLRNELGESLNQANSTIADLRKAQLDTMNPEDRSAAMMQQLMEKMDGKGANNASDKPNPFTQTAESQQDKVSGQDQQAAGLAQQRAEMGKSLSDKFGIDATKLDWADGETGTVAMEKFMESFATAIKSVSTGKPDEDPNPVDTKNQPGGDAFDLNTSDPGDLIRSGASKVRPSIDGGPNSSPWL